ncbi:MAG: class I SAM-dependent methyltransferase [Nitrospirota bacterium]
MSARSRSTSMHSGRACEDSACSVRRRSCDTSRSSSNRCRRQIPMKEIAFLKTMVQKVHARSVLEIGTFDGTSALAMAECLPDDGKLITCEINAGLAALARKRASRHPHGHKIDVRTGPALEILPQLGGPFDLIFIDADTCNYAHYYHHAMMLLSPTGVLLMDNMQASEMVLPTPTRDVSGAVIQKLAHELASDTQVDAVLTPVRDGVMVVMPRPRPNQSS